MKSLSLRTKLLFLSGFLLVISITVGSISYRALTDVTSDYDQVVDLSVPKLSLAYEMMLDYRRTRITLETLGLAGLSKEHGEATLKDLVVAIEAYENHEKEYLRYPFAPGQKEISDEVAASWLEFKGMGETVVALYNSGAEKDKLELERLLVTEFPEKAKIYTADVHKLLDFLRQMMLMRVNHARHTALQSNYVIFGLIFAGIIMGLSISLLVANRITRVMGNVARDLTAGAEQVAQASSQISASSQDLAHSSSEQASSLEETVATMEEMSSTVKISSENGRQAAELAVATRDVATRGESEIRTLVDAIFSISSDSKKIEEIITVIDDIAFQTNLLALNASVEAARAGEHGKGFAVVADAVRTLSQRTTVAAKDINQLIKGSVQKIETGAIQAERGGKVLTEILHSAKKVADLNGEIASASEEQHKGISQISAAMNKLEEVVQQNAAASEEAAAAAEELSAQSANLRLNAEVLNTELFGRKTS